MPGYVLITLICSPLLCALCAYVAWKQASESLTLAKRLRVVEPQIADLRSEYESLLESHKKLRSRIGMRELRERRAAEEAPQHESKAALRRRLGLAGLSGPQFAARQMGLERAEDSD